MAVRVVVVVVVGNVVVVVVAWILTHIWFCICNRSLYHVFIIAPLHLVVDDVLWSLSDLIDFKFWYIFFILQ